MTLSLLFPHRCGRNFWDVWDWPQYVFGQQFGSDLDEFSDVVQTRSTQALARRTGASEVANSSDKFSVRLDCSQFRPEEIEVKTVGNSIVIHAKHEERNDRHGWVEREFTRKYTLPEGCEAERVVSSMTSDGVLAIDAPKKVLKPIKQTERIVPIELKRSAEPTTNGPKTKQRRRV